MTEQLSVGATLKAAREQAKFQRVDVTRDLNFSNSQLIALESDRFSALPGETFARGYLRTYAKWLGLDVAALMAQYLEQTGQAQQAGLEKSARVGTRDKVTSPVDGNQKVFAATAVVAVMVFAAWLYSVISNDEVLTEEPLSQVDELKVDSVLPQRDTDTAVEATASVVDKVSQPQQSLTVVDEAAVVTPQASEITAPGAQQVIAEAQDLVDGLSIQQIEQEAIQAQQQADNAQLAAAVASQQLAPVDADIDKLHFQFSADCWLEVRDRNQVLIYSGLGKAGLDKRVSGKAPFEVLLGFARGVEVSLNDQSFVFTPKQNKNSLRITIGNS